MTEEIIDSELAIIDQQDQERFALESEIIDATTGGELSMVEWYLRVFAENKDTEKRVKEQYHKIIAQLKARRASLTRFASREVERVVTSELESAHGKKRSIDTLYGRTGFRSTKGSVKVIDSELFLDWLDSQPIEIRGKLDECIDRKVSRTASIRNYIEDTGDLPDGVHFTPPSQKFYPVEENTERLEFTND